MNALPTFSYTWNPLAELAGGMALTPGVTRYKQVRRTYESSRKTFLEVPAP